MKDRRDLLVMVAIIFMVVVGNLLYSNHTSASEEETAPTSIEVESTTEVIKVKEEPTSKLGYRINVTADDVALMARVVMSEASIESYDCKVAIAEVIINRVMSDKFPDTVQEVINQKKQFSTRDNGEVNAECYAAVYEALQYQRHPGDMYYFRANKYHDNYGQKYMRIDNTYFSVEDRTAKE